MRKIVVCACMHAYMRAGGQMGGGRGCEERGHHMMIVMRSAATRVVVDMQAAVLRAPTLQNDKMWVKV